MNRCPITYKICKEGRYSPEGLHLLSKRLKREPTLPLSAQQQITLAGKLAEKLSIAGVQSKLSLRLNTEEASFEAVERGGIYILKPPHPLYPELPENEDLTMHLAQRAGIEVPFHCLIYSADNSLSYLIRRFDRPTPKKKLPMEDFSQLSGHNRDSKYDSSMEKLVPVVEEHCSFPVVEKMKLFRLCLFCFLTGNEDMHLKNFSLIRRQGKVTLSPAYDLLNSSMVVEGREELALTLKGKRRKISRSLLCDYFGVERLGLSQAVVGRELKDLQLAQKDWNSMIKRSFLSEKSKEAYHQIVLDRAQRLFCET